MGDIERVSDRDWIERGNVLVETAGGDKKCYKNYVKVAVIALSVVTSLILPHTYLHMYIYMYL